METKIYDVIIIGGGAAGLTAAIYTSRESIKTLVLEKNLTGGLAASTDLVENYPGFAEGISGMELMDRFKEQAGRFGAEITEFKEVNNLSLNNKEFVLKTDQEVFKAWAVIVASGSVPKRLDIPGEDVFKGKGVSYCATCDGPLFKGKDVSVIGCGNSGLQEGEALLKYTKSVTFIEFLPYMTAQKILQERIQKNEKAKFFLNHKLTVIKGKDIVEAVIIKDRATDKEKDIPVQGVFIYAGYLPNSDFVKGLIELDQHGYIVTDERMKTSLEGVFAAGDIRSKEVRQIDTACAEGTIAAISVRDYLKNKF
ncbi:MAG: thioredoxin-disulfide reductase [Candidatus Omnitrophica bacterium]|nr:thioredoxin-disulfide reductase [Candidatus Omnitrophota bacterium]